MKFCIVLFLTISAGAFIGYLARPGRQSAGSPSLPSADVPAVTAATPLTTVSLNRLHAELAAGKPDYLRALREAMAAGDVVLAEMLLLQLTARDPAAALQWVAAGYGAATEAGASLSSYHAWYLKVAETWAAQAPRTALDACLKYQSQVPAPAWTLFALLEQSQPALAAEFLRDHPQAFADAGDLGTQQFAMVARVMAVMPPGVSRAQCISKLLDSILLYDASVDEVLARGRATMQILSRCTASEVRSVVDDFAFKHNNNGHITAEMFTPECLACIESSLGAGSEPLRRFYKAYLSDMLSNDPLGALAAVEHKLTGITRQSVRSDAFRALASKSPATARQMALDLPPGRERETIIGSICSTTIGSLNPEKVSETLKWIHSLPANDPARHSALASIANDWTQAAPTEVLEYLRKANVGDVPSGFLTNAVYGLGESGDAESMLEILATNPHLPKNDRALTTLSDKAVKANPDTAEQLLHRLPPQSVARNAMVNSLATHLWRTDAEAAIRLGQSLPAADLAIVRSSLAAVGLPPEAAASYQERCKAQ